jgi:hypothetical protein
VSGPALAALILFEVGECPFEQHTDGSGSRWHDIHRATPCVDAVHDGARQCDAHAFACGFWFHAANLPDTPQRVNKKLLTTRRVQAHGARVRPMPSGPTRCVNTSDGPDPDLGGNHGPGYQHP